MDVNLKDQDGAFAEYYRLFERELSNLCAMALDGDIVGSTLIFEMLYPPEAVVRAASAGMIEKFPAGDCAAIFAVCHAMSFERSNGKLARIASASVRRKYDLHVRIASLVKTHRPYLAADVFRRFQSAFVEQR